MISLIHLTLIKNKCAFHQIKINESGMDISASEMLDAILFKNKMSEQDIHQRRF